MTDDVLGHVSLQRAYQAAVQTLTALRSNEEDLPRTLDEGILKKLLLESFALQFEDDQARLEKRVLELLDEKIDAQKHGAGQE
jgi:hypothetical protein